MFLATVNSHEYENLVPHPIFTAHMNTLLLYIWDKIQIKRANQTSNMTNQTQQNIPEQFH